MGYDWTQTIGAYSGKLLLFLRKHPDCKDKHFLYQFIVRIIKWHQGFTLNPRVFQQAKSCFLNPLLGFMISLLRFTQQKLHLKPCRFFLMMYAISKVALLDIPYRQWIRTPLSLEPSSMKSLHSSKYWEIFQVAESSNGICLYLYSRGQCCSRSFPATRIWETSNNCRVLGSRAASLLPRNTPLIIWLYAGQYIMDWPQILYSSASQGFRRLQTKEPKKQKFGIVGN